ncbi:MAG: phosphatase PAP2 family protein [Bacteroidia bacterium]|nr:phosphatase PAP2 family protein [Bacteroidia bacterium]
MQKVKLLGILLLFFSISGHTQVDTLIKKLDSLRIQKDSTGVQNNIIKDTAYNENTRFTFSSYFILLGSDLKQEITAPFHFQKRDWFSVGKIALTTAALMFADEPVQRVALKLRDSSSSVRNISKYVTNFGGLYEGYTLAALGTYGLIFKNEKIKTTTLLATQAYITGAAMEALLKFISGRQRPYYYNADVPEAEPLFHGPFSKPGNDINGKRLNSSFPSGHTTVAFAAATVFALEYKDKPFIPILSYSVATLIGLSRITENKHWISDVFVGAVLGYYTGKQVVNNYHRYAKLKETDPKKKKVFFNLDYSHGSLLTGIVWKL